MREKIYNVLFTYFGEANRQRCFFENMDKKCDLRAAMYASFVNTLLLQVMELLWDEEEELLHLIHHHYIENTVSANHPELAQFQTDRNWLLLKLEETIFHSHPIYEQLPIEDRTQKPDIKKTSAMLEVLRETGVHFKTNEVWQLDDEAYLIGTSLADSSDFWIYNFGQIESNHIVSQRLGDLSIDIRHLKQLRC
ncbi:MAG: hypothetical protein JXQ90_18245 [Cyclobacteriaceae bacterium]